MDVEENPTWSDKEKGSVQSLSSCYGVKALLKGSCNSAFYVQFCSFFFFFFSVPSIQPSQMDSPMLTSNIGIVLPIVCMYSAWQRKNTWGDGSELPTPPSDRAQEPCSSLWLQLPDRTPFF